MNTELFATVFGGDTPEMKEALYTEYKALASQDVADAVMGALAMPPHADVNRIEIASVNQALGGAI